MRIRLRYLKEHVLLSNSVFPCRGARDEEPRLSSHLQECQTSSFRCLGGILSCYSRLTFSELSFVPGPGQHRLPFAPYTCQACCEKKEAIPNSLALRRHHAILCRRRIPPLLFVHTARGVSQEFSFQSGMVVALWESCLVILASFIPNLFIQSNIINCAIGFMMSKESWKRIGESWMFSVWSCRFHEPPMYHLMSTTPIRSFPQKRFPRSLCLWRKDWGAMAPNFLFWALVESGKCVAIGWNVMFAWNKICGVTIQLTFHISPHAE